MRALAVLGAGMTMLALVACGKPAAENVAETTLNSTPQAVAADSAPAPAANVTLPRVEGSFAAVSNTAMSVTGDLTLASDKLRFALDQEYATGPVRAVRADSVYADGDSWADLFGISPETPIEIRTVNAEKTGAKARNGGLCGNDKADFVAIAVKAAGTADALLLLSAFKGGTAPGQGAPADRLCGTYTYMPGGG